MVDIQSRTAEIRRGKKKKKEEEERKKQDENIYGQPPSQSATQQLRASGMQTDICNRSLICYSVSN